MPSPSLFKTFFSLLFAESVGSLKAQIFQKNIKPQKSDGKKNISAGAHSYTRAKFQGLVPKTAWTLASEGILDFMLEPACSLHRFLFFLFYFSCF